MFKSIIAGVVLGVASMSVSAQGVQKDTLKLYAGVVTCGELMYAEEEQRLAITGYVFGIVDQLNVSRYVSKERQVKVSVGRLFGELFDQCLENEELPLLVAVQRSYAKLLSI